MPADSRRIVLTGVSRGLGLALAEEFIARGHVVWGCARSAKAIESLGKRWPAPNHFSVVDIRDDRQVARWAADVLSSGPPDLLINNAAVINRNAPLWDLSAEEFSTVVDVNINGIANVVRHFAPAMIENRRGVIVNFSSGWGRSTAPEVAPYCASKYAVEGLTLALAQELPAGMAAVPLNPGIIDTDMLRSCFGAEAASYPPPAEWAKTAATMILGLSPRDNGKSLSVRD